jgi:lipoate-protein ligase A
MTWRYIPFQYYDPYFKTGLNRALIESVADGADPVIFLAGWEKNCINIGYSQEIEQQVDLEEFEKREDLVIVRRQGGGGTTYLTREGEITWGVVAPENMFPDDVNRIYSQVCGEIAEALGRIDIEAQHEPVNDVVSSEGKLSGSTIKQQDGVVYIGGTLIYDVDPEEMFSVLTPGEEKIGDKEIEDFRERVSSVKAESNASFEQTRRALRDQLLQDRNHVESGLNDSEKARAEELAEKYSRDEWVWQK